MGMAANSMVVSLRHCEASQSDAVAISSDTNRDERIRVESERCQLTVHRKHLRHARMRLPRRRYAASRNDGVRCCL